MLVEHDTGVAAGKAGRLVIDLGKLEVGRDEEAVVHALHDHRTLRRLTRGCDIEPGAARLGGRRHRQQDERQRDTQRPDHCSPRRLTFSGVV